MHDILVNADRVPDRLVFACTVQEPANAMEPAPPPPDHRPLDGALAVLVLGMHRSGTSAIARFIGELGAALPSEPAPPGKDNPAGFWEPAAIVQINDALLRDLDTAWLDVRPPELARMSPSMREAFIAQASEALGRNFGKAASYVLKDPRLCRLLPLYRDVLQRIGSDPRVVLVLRDPHEVAASLAARDQLSPSTAGLLWAQHMIEAERQSRDLKRVVVTYDDVLHDWRAVVGALSPLLGACAAATGSITGETLRPELRHHTGRMAATFHPRLRDQLNALHTALLDLADNDSAAHRATIDTLADALTQTAKTGRDVFEAEFQYQRLTSAHDTARPRDTESARADMAAALERAQSAHWAAQPPRRPHRPVSNPHDKAGLFLAGVQKGGTTSLFAHLARHPQLAPPGRKETHFFDDETQDWQSPDYQHFHDWFASDSAGLLRFDATPIYSFWAPALDRIRTYNPDARLVLLFRDPVARAVSHWRMERERGTEQLSFADAVRAEPQRLAAAMWSRAWREHSYVTRGRYGEQLARIVSRFPRDQLLLLRSDAFYRDQRATLARIADFLEISPFPDLPAMHALEGRHPEHANKAEQDAIRALLADDMHCFASLSGLDVADWLPDEIAPDSRSLR